MSSSTIKTFLFVSERKNRKIKSFLEMFSSFCYDLVLFSVSIQNQTLDSLWKKMIAHQDMYIACEI